MTKKKRERNEKNNHNNMNELLKKYVFTPTDKGNHKIKCCRCKKTFKTDVISPKQMHISMCYHCERMDKQISYNMDRHRSNIFDHKSFF